MCDWTIQRSASGFGGPWTEPQPVAGTATRTGVVAGDKRPRARWEDPFMWQVSAALVVVLATQSHAAVSREHAGQPRPLARPRACLRWNGVRHERSTQRHTGLQLHLGAYVLEGRSHELDRQRC
jgi:hypothetical protein